MRLGRVTIHVADPGEGDADVQALVDQIMPILAGNEPEIVGATLADLTSMLLAGFQGPHKQDIREEMLTEFIAVVRKLTPLNEAAILEKIRSQGH